MKKNIKNTLLLHIAWSTILLFLGIIGVFYGFMFSYTVCCIGIAIIFSFELFPSDEALYKTFISFFIIILFAPILMYVMWLFTIYYLILELERNV